MSMLEKSGGPGEDARDGGTRQNDPVNIAILRRLKKEREALWVENQLMWAKICRKRADVRNSLRGLFERSRLLAEVFGVRYVGAVTANDISMEENGRRNSKLRKTALKERDTHPVETLRFASEWEIYLDDREIRNSEYVKYLGGKLEALLKEGDFGGARGFIEENRRKAGGGDLESPFEQELIYRMAGFYSRCIIGGEVDAFARAFAEIGTCVKIVREDLFDVKDGELGDEDLVAALEMRTTGFKAKSPDLYKKLMEYFAEIGLYAGRK